MKDAYWENAQKLLEENERRRRRTVWWWSGGAGIVLALVAAYFFFVPMGNKNNLTAQKAGAFSDENKIEKKLNDNIKVEDKNTEKAKQGIFEKKEENGFEIKKEQKTNPSAGLNPGIKNNIKKGPELTNENTKPGINGDHKLNQKEPDGGDFEPTATNMFFEKNKSENKTEGFNLNKKDAETEVETSGDINGPENPGVADLELAAVTVPDEIPALRIYVENEEKEGLETSEPEPFAKRKTSIGISAAQFFQTTPKSDEQSAIVFRGGIFMKYKWSDKNNIYLLSGLNYQRRTGTFERSKLAETKKYSFGLQRDTNMLRPSSVHTVSLPVLLGMEKGRHIIEAGISVDYLTGVRGERGGFGRIPGSDPPAHGFVPVESGWISEDGFKKWTATGQLNYRFRVSTQWSFGLSANYIFGGVLENINPGLPGGNGVELKEDDNFHLGFQAVYILKR